MKKFWKVVGVILLFVGIAYFGAEMEKREEYGHSGDSDFGLEDFLGIKKWPYQDHLFVNGKKNGDCKELKGNLLLAVIFVDENGNSWSSAEMETAKKEVYESSERLKREAASYGISIEMNHQFLHGSADQGIKKENQDAWVEQALSSVGFQNKDKVIKNLTSTYSATEAAVLFLVESEGRSFADTVRGNDDGFECVFLYADLGGDYLHELLHVFGARDFYYPDEKGVKRKTILCRKITVLAED